MWKRFEFRLKRASRGRFEREVDDELRFHLEARVKDLAAAGLSRTEAERRARLEFGSIEKAKEECREASGWAWVDELRRNAAFALRILVRNPAFAVSVVLTLGLCIGANTAVFSLVDSVLFQPLPYPEPDRLALVATRYQSRESDSTVVAQDGLTWELIRDHADFLERAVYSAWTNGVNLSARERPLHVAQQRVGTGFFSVLGVAPQFGREFNALEDESGGPAVTILAASLASQLFGGASAAIGQVVQLRGEPYLVVGVMPAGFDSGVEADLWTPLRPNTTGEGRGINYRILARLPPGLTLEEARSRVVALGKHDPRQRNLPPEVSRSLWLVGLQEGQTEYLRPTLAALWAFVAVVLVLGCVNIAGLLLARNGWRRREIAIRIALGGGRAAVTRQMLTEGLVLAVSGGLAGLAFAFWGKPVLESLIREGLGITQPIQLDARTLVFTAAVALCGSVVFGLIPAYQARRLDIHPVLAEGDGRGVAGGGRYWSRRLLVVAQVAMVAALLTGAGLLIRTFSSLRALQPGFEPAQAATAKVSLHSARYATTEEVNVLLEAALTELSGRPGVEAVGVGLTLPYERALNLQFKRMDGPAADDRDGRLTNLIYVTPGYFEALRMRLQRGRLLNSFDRAGAQPVVVVNQAFVETYFSGEDPIGRRIALSSETREIVGVVDDVQVKPSWGDFGPLGQVPVVYMPVAQSSSDFLQMVHTWFSPSFVVRSPLPFHEVAAELKRAVQSRNPQLPLFAVRPMEAVMARSWSRQRVLATLVASLAGLALLLAAVGIYGLIANSVVERRREIGIRMALGATVGKAIRGVAASGIWLTLAGIALGGAAAWWGRETIAHLVWGVPTSDPLTFAAAALVLLLTAAAASLAPSLKVARIDPADILRE